MGVAMALEGSYRHLPVNVEKSAAKFRAWIADPDYCVLVAMHDGKVIGFVIGFVASHDFHDGLGAWDKLFYLRPEARGSGYAYRLYRAFRQWAAAKGALDVWPGVSTADGKAVQFYQRMGLEAVGVLFRDPLSDNAEVATSQLASQGQQPEAPCG